MDRSSSSSSKQSYARTSFMSNNLNLCESGGCNYERQCMCYTSEPHAMTYVNVEQTRRTSAFHRDVIDRKTSSRNKNVMDDNPPETKSDTDDKWKRIEKRMQTDHDKLRVTYEDILQRNVDIYYSEKSIKERMHQLKRQEVILNKRQKYLETFQKNKAASSKVISELVDDVDVLYEMLKACMERQNEKYEALEKKEKDIFQKGQEIKSSNAKLTEQEKILEIREEDLMTKQHQNDVKGGFIEEYEEELNKKERDLTLKNKEVSEREDELDKLDEIMQIREENVLSKEHSIEITKNHLENSLNFLSKREAEMRSRENEIRQKNDEIKRIEEGVIEQKKALLVKEKELSSFENQIKAKENALLCQEAVMEERKNVLDASETAVKMKEKDLAAKEARIELLENDLVSREAKINIQENNLLSAIDKLKSRETDLNSMESKMETYFKDEESDKMENLPSSTELKYENCCLAVTPASVEKKDLAKAIDCSSPMLDVAESSLSGSIWRGLKNVVNPFVPFPLDYLDSKRNANYQGMELHDDDIPHVNSDMEHAMESSAVKCCIDDSDDDVTKNLRKTVQFAKSSSLDITKSSNDFTADGFGLKSRQIVRFPKSSNVDIEKSSTDDSDNVLDMKSRRTVDFRRIHCFNIPKDLAEEAKDEAELIPFPKSSSFNVTEEVRNKRVLFSDRRNSVPTMNLI